MQLDDLRAGLATGNVGQRPFDMGYKVMYALKDMKDGKAPPPDPTYTGLTSARRRTSRPASAAGSS
jgi:ribose transport system substrate-binding protein